MAFRQYNINKPAKYRFFFRNINGVRFHYTYTGMAYAGKPMYSCPNLSTDLYYLASTYEYVKILVHNLDRISTLQARNLSLDRFYTSLELAERPWKKNITLVDTWQTMRKGVSEVSSLSDPEPLSTKVFWEETKPHLTITSYVVKPKSMSKPNVLILSTMQSILGVTKDDRKEKPLIIKLYGFAKRGADVVDQNMRNYSVKPKSWK